MRKWIWSGLLVVPLAVAGALVYANTHGDTPQSAKNVSQPGCCSQKPKGDSPKADCCDSPKASKPAADSPKAACCAKPTAAAQSGDSARQIVFKVEGLTCPAVQGLGCGHRLEPVFTRLQKIDGVEQVLSNRLGTMIRVSVAASADNATVTEAVLNDLTEDRRSPVRLTSAELAQTLKQEQWRSPGELSSIEFRTLALKRVSAFAESEKLDQQAADKLAEEQWDRLAKQADAKPSPGKIDWAARRAEFAKAVDEQAKELLTADQHERLRQALVSTRRKTN